MKHLIEVQDLSQVSSPILTEDQTTFSTGDTIIFSVPNHRDQVEAEITSINRERVFKGWCYLGLRLPDIKAVHNISQQ